MEYLELVFWAVAFVCCGLLIGRYLVPNRFKLVYVALIFIAGMMWILFSDVNLNFPIGKSTTGAGALVPYWMVLFDLSFRFVLIGAFLSLNFRVGRDKA